MEPTRRDFQALLFKSQLLRALAFPAGASAFAAHLQAQPHTHSSSAPPDPQLLAHYQPQFFDPADFAALQSFTELLIPTDATPGAREAHCALFIDFLLANAAAVPTLQHQWRDALTALKTAGFHHADPAGRAQLLAAIAAPESDPKATHPAFSAYRLIKKETVFAFYTSRAGMIDTLDYRGNSYNAVFPACTHPEHQGTGAA